MRRTVASQEWDWALAEIDNDMVSDLALKRGIHAVMGVIPVCVHIFRPLASLIM